MNKINTSVLKSDFSSGLVVFLVALPLCLGIALASGVPLISGLIAGIIGGIVVGFLSGSSVSVSGPAAGLTVIVITAINDLGSFEAFLTAVILAGVLQLVFGYIKAGIVSHYFPSSVIKGMLAAIGLILIMKQIPHAIGYDVDYEGDFTFMQQDGENTFTEIIRSIDFLEPGAVFIFIIAIAILLLWETDKIKSLSFSKLIPGSLVAVIAGVAINELFEIFYPDVYLTGTHVVSLPMPESLSAFVGQFHTPDFGVIANKNVIFTAITIAIVASIETLLSIEASDKLDPYKRVTSTNRELKAQGIGNILSGLIGGIPMTSVIVRSSANIASGAQTKLSAIIHGFLLLISVLLIPNILNLIPLSALAALLIVIGYKLAKISLFKSMFNLGWNQFLPFVITILAILFTDLLVGIGIGVNIAIFFILRNNYRSPYHYKSEPDGDDHKILITLSEEVTFLNKGKMLIELQEIPDNSDVVIDGSRSKNISYDVLEVIDNFKESTKFRNINLELIDLEDKYPHR